MAVRQNYHKECEAGVNKQIGVEFYGMYQYQCMANFFERFDAALPGLSEFFHKVSHEKLERAECLMKYQNDRGGRVVFSDIQAPKCTVEGYIQAKEAMEEALAFETRENKALLELHKIADKHNDSQMQSFVEDRFLGEQVETTKQIADYITQLSRVGEGHGEYHFDKSLQ